MKEIELKEIEMKEIGIIRIIFLKGNEL